MRLRRIEKGLVDKPLQEGENEEDDNRRKVEAAHWWEESSNRSQNGFGQTIDRIDDRVMRIRIEPGHQDPGNHNVPVEIDDRCENSHRGLVVGIGL